MRIDRGAEFALSQRHSEILALLIAREAGMSGEELAGIEPGLAAEVMGTSSIGSPMLKARIPLLLDLPEQAWFDVALMDKDIRLARSAADELGIMLPSAAGADDMLTTASEHGYAHRDLAPLHQVLTELATTGDRH